MKISISFGFCFEYISHQKEVSFYNMGWLFSIFEDVGRFLDTRETSSSWNSSGWGHCFCYKHRQVFYLLLLLHHKHHEVLYLLHHPHHQEMQWWPIINVRKNQVRKLRPGAVESWVQEQALASFHRWSVLWLWSGSWMWSWGLLALIGVLNVVLGSCGFDRGLKCGLGVLWWF